MLAEIFESSIATGNHARRLPLDLSMEGIQVDSPGPSRRSTPIPKRRNEAIQDGEENGTDSKKLKLTVAEGISQLVSEMMESRKARMDIANKPDRAIKSFISKYTEVDISDYSKVLDFLSEPKNATIFLALDGPNTKQKEWLEEALGIWFIEK